MISVILMTLSMSLNNPICKERGHLPGNYIEETLMKCEDKVEDYKDSTVVISHDCNIKKTICKRCGEQYILPNRPDTRKVIWKLNNDK